MDFNSTIPLAIAATFLAESSHSSFKGAKSALSLVGLLMSAMLSGNTPSASLARARGLRKQRHERHVSRKPFGRVKREERNGNGGSSNGESRGDGGNGESGDVEVTGAAAAASVAKTSTEAADAGSGSAAVEDEVDGVERGGVQEKTGEQPTDEPESPAAGVVSGEEEEETLSEADVEGKTVPDAVAKAALYAPKRSRRSRVKQRREGAVSNHDRGSDVARDSGSRSFEKDLPRSRSDDGSGRPGGGVADGAAATAGAGALAESRVTDAQESTGLDGEEDVECFAFGPCERCEEPTLDAEYCKETGRRQEVRCTPRNAPDAFAIVRQEGQAGVVGLPSSIQYRSCEFTDEDELQGLLRFWISMVIIGVVACFGMRKRQKKIKSLYDQRAM